MRWALVLLLTAALTACGEDEPPQTSSRGARTRGAQPATGVDPEDVLPTRPESSGRRRHRVAPAVGGAPSAAPSPGGGVVTAHDDEAERDPDAALTRDLERAFGTPTDCLGDETRDRLGEHMTVNVSVRVTSTGRVVSATVTGPGLSEPDLECMTTRAENLSLTGPIERAPRTVAARIRYDVEDTRVTASSRDYLPEREPGAGTLRPDSTLPAARSATDRPTGFVAPTTTLPGNEDIEPGPAPGYVPPGSTLPASAEDAAER